MIPLSHCKIMLKNVRETVDLAESNIFWCTESLNYSTQSRKTGF